MSKCGIAYFDKKVTNYQIYVDRLLQEQEKKIKTNEDYLTNSIDSQNQKIDSFIAEQENTSSSEVNFTRVKSTNFTNSVNSVTLSDVDYKEVFIFSSVKADLTVTIGSNTFTVPYVTGSLRTDVSFRNYGGLLIIDSKYHLANSCGNTNHVTTTSTVPPTTITNITSLTVSSTTTTGSIQIYAR